MQSLRGFREWRPGQKVVNTFLNDMTRSQLNSQLILAGRGSNRQQIDLHLVLTRGTNNIFVSEYLRDLNSLAGDKESRMYAGCWKYKGLKEMALSFECFGILSEDNEETSQ